MLSAAGFEHVHEFHLMIMGRQKEFRGVPSFTGHYHGLMCSRIRQGDIRKAGFFNVKNCRYFLQTGLACRAKSYPDDVLKACCKLRQLTGDGTGIGVPVKNVLHCPPVWHPRVAVKQPKAWSRMDRCVLRPRPTILINRKEAKEARTYLRNVLKCMDSNTVPHIHDIQHMLVNCVPPCILNEILRFVGLPASDETFHLSMIIKVLGSEDCVSSMFQLPVLHPLEEIISAGETGNWTQMNLLLTKHKPMLGQRGLALSVWAIFTFQLHNHSIVFSSTLAFFRFLGEYLQFTDSQL